ncbi:MULTISPECIES: carboxymuconolactone decarboxylase family protein [Alphaproteobacteria]|uniref:carboxymuconolactone decarboxylase family protein n=1 Tax=Alphaproteobacteria TaxID=28211 RepID=UPI003A8DF926
MIELKRQMMIAAGILSLATPMAPAFADTSNQAEGQATQQSRAQQIMGDIAPKLAELTDDVLYADIWEREGLSKRDRSLITVSALVAMNRPAQLHSHIGLALRNGVTKEEVVETITQMAFYAGWPNSVTAVSVARDAFEAFDAQTAQ